MRNMADQKNRDERVEKLMNRLAESVLGLSDETILAETSEAGVAPQQEAERARSVLRHASKRFTGVNKRLSNLGHTINSNDWSPSEAVYHNVCQTCGLFVSLAPATGEMQGSALDGLCPGTDQYAVRRRAAVR
jgi:hypothetical protein